MRRLSATMALAPPGPRSLAIVVNRCARSTSRSFMVKKGREGCVQEQDYLTCRFKVIITNSPPTGSEAMSPIMEEGGGWFVVATFFQVGSIPLLITVCERSVFTR